MNWLREEYWVFVGIHNDDITEMKWTDCPIRGDRRRRTCNAFKAQLGNWEVTFKSKECICLHFLGLIFVTYTTDVHVFISYRLDNPDNAAVCCFLFTHCVRSIELHTCMLPLFYKKEHCIVRWHYYLSSFLVTINNHSIILTSRGHLNKNGQIRSRCLAAALNRRGDHHDLS